MCTNLVKKYSLQGRDNLKTIMVIRRNYWNTSHSLLP